MAWLDWTQTGWAVLEPHVIRLIKLAVEGKGLIYELWPLDSSRLCYTGAVPHYHAAALAAALSCSADAIKLPELQAARTSIQMH